MSRSTILPIVAATIFVAAASSLQAQNQYIGYAFPAGGQQGTTFPLRLGGQGLAHVSDVVVSGAGVSVRLVDHYRVMDNQELSLISQQLNELRKQETMVDDVMATKMAFFEFPARIGPEEEAAPSETKPNDEPAPPEKEVAKKNLIDRIERRFAEDERMPAVPSQTELVFAEVTVDPDAKPGRREIRVITRRGVSNALPFFVGQVSEVARKPMKTCQLPVLGKEHLAQRKRPPGEEEPRVTVPCTMNGQIAAGEVNRYRFQATKGQQLVISVMARQLIPYVADGVPGWLQAVLRLFDANGKELAYSDDFRSNPDPLIHFEVPDDGEYVLTINEALFRGRESFVYRITIGELPFVTSIFPLGGRVGEPVNIEMHGWNLENTTLAPPPQDAKPGRYRIAATNGTLVSNDLPFVLDTLPECLDQEPNDEPSQAQQVSLPVIVNGRADRPGDWDVFAVDGTAGQTIVLEVEARRLGSPYDSFVKVTGPDGKVIALNDDHHDAGSGMNTDHADSYLMVTLPTDGKYLIHLGDTRRHAGKEFAYRLRISQPRPDFVLRLIPSRLCIPSTGSAAVKVFAIRKDGFDGPIALNFKDLPEGFASPGATLAANQEVVDVGISTSLAAMEKPVDLTLVGTAKIGDQELVREAAPAEDRMQAFLWRHLVSADTLPALVFDPSYQPSADRIRPLIRDEDRPQGVQPTLQKSSVDWYLRQIEGLYQDWFLTDEFANREIANIEARLIK
ncbi:MAG: hypothetical protein FJ276_04715 [Planctomycetes bacterium]|nr:hypothetical protein [Planctomycetota bacterium]